MKYVIGLTTLLFVAGLTACANAQDEEGWNFALALGGNATAGNSETLSLNASVTGTRAMEDAEIRTGIEASYAEAVVENEAVVEGEGEVAAEGAAPDRQTTAQNVKALVNYKRRFEGWYAYTDDSVLHDRLADVDYRVLLGLGAGTRLVETEKDRLDVEGGLAYVVEQISDIDPDNYPAFRVAARHDHQLNETSVLWASAEFLPEIGAIKNFLLNAEAGAEVAVNSTLSLRIVVQDRYDGDVPEGKENNDLTFATSVVYKL
ncbi:MAG: DUF481 domain-containing protein [Lentisphaerae bacterium]|nr:DUF481 domain-containing protein [Lentisphaerota bacterium]